MVSTQFLTGVLALFAANAVSAGPCKPSSSTVYTATTGETTTTETSSATVSESFTETLTSLGSTETETTNSLYLGRDFNCPRYFHDIAHHDK
ncbi:uncharacterized protein FIESC28_06603 [Fusarium coffeatum]|uniref:Uncharacterized protein n=1 Tax=Fusarium coffeatum TaxID=231269 RepID=A0A366RIV9_9HYPO|nr:uncharacterized protein FIESC28_06603 [Fusarium coffeatum]RBR17101.1 hypothetical protein FIESC28_06603 [Fusarium coffeatum]